MKSAYELAMERLQQQSPSAGLTPEQREQLAEIDSVFKARIAEREFNLGAHLAQARRQGDLTSALELEEQLRREVLRLEQEAEQAKNKLRQEFQAS